MSTTTVSTTDLIRRIAAECGRAWAEQGVDPEGEDTAWTPDLVSAEDLQHIYSEVGRSELTDEERRELRDAHRQAYEEALADD